jgi:hypothetical protein
MTAYTVLFEDWLDVLVERDRLGRGSDAGESGKKHKQSNGRHEPPRDQDKRPKLILTSPQRQQGKELPLLALRGSGIMADAQ